MANARARQDIGIGAALTRRESRRAAELIVRACLDREPLERLSSSLPGLSRNDARIIRDDVVELSQPSAQSVGMICAHSIGDPVFIGERMLSYGTARVLSAGDRLNVAAFAGVRGSFADLMGDGEPNGALESMVSLVVTREPYGEGAVSAEDLICANGGVICAAIALLPEVSNSSDAELHIGSLGEERVLGLLPRVAELHFSARALLREAEKASSRAGRIIRASAASTEKVTLMGTMLSAPLSLDAGAGIGLLVDGSRVLEAIADPDHFI